MESSPFFFFSSFRAIDIRRAIRPRPLRRSVFYAIIFKPKCQDHRQAPPDGIGGRCGLPAFVRIARVATLRHASRPDLSLSAR